MTESVEDLPGPDAERRRKVSKDVDPLDFEAVEKAANEAAKRANAIWIAFITLNVYIFIATLTVTPLSLLRGDPVSLPIFNAQLPVATYFCIAPLLILTAYFYLIVQLQGLSEKIAAYEGLLLITKKFKADREWMRQRLDNSVFARVLSERHERWPSRAARAAFRAQAILSVVVGPLAVATIAQLTHLPNQNEAVNNAQRVLVVATVAVAAWFWFGVFRPRNLLANLGAAFLFAGICFFCTLVAVFPGEYLYDHQRPSWIQTYFTRPLLESAPDRVTLAARFPFSNRLVLIQQLVGDQRTGSQGGTMLMLRGRNLRNAIFEGTLFRNVDLTGADLVRASMRSAIFESSNFGCADLRCTNFSGADLTEANLSGAKLDGIIAYGVNLERSMLVGAHLNRAQLQGALLDDAHLEGANLWGAGMQGASLRQASFNAATLWEAELQGTNFGSATLQASELGGALMQNAIFDYAGLEGAAIRGTGLKDASFVCVKMFRAEFDRQDFEDAVVKACPEDQGYSYVTVTYDKSSYTPEHEKINNFGTTVSPADYVGCSPYIWERKLDTEATFQEFLDRCKSNFTTIDDMKSIEYRFKKLSPSAKTLDEDAQEKILWSEVEKKESHSPSVTLVERLKLIACVGEGAPFVARGLLHYRFTELEMDDRRLLVSALKTAAQTRILECPGVHELTPSEFDESLRLKPPFLRP
jgi:uncharacterized protein YjbI with pentapeptide repeats